MYHDNDNPWGSLINMIVTTIVAIFAFKEGKRAMAHEIHHEAMQFQIDDLRRKLAEQNRINEQVRKITGI